MLNQQKKTNEFSEFPHVSHGHMQTMMKCLSICAACAKMCIKEGHKNTAILCSDCADICALTIKLHSSDSEFNRQVLDLCSKACKRCGDECAKMDVKHCQQCSTICLECSKACTTAE